jgi:hypothetical protein
MRIDRPAPNRRSESSIIAPPRSVPLLAFCVSGVRSATFANLPETWPFPLDFEPFLVNFGLKPGDFKDWCQQAGERERTQKAFAQALEDHGFARERTRSAKGFSHIGLKTDTAPDVPRTPDMPVTHTRARTSYIGEPGTCGTGEPKVTQ